MKHQKDLTASGWLYALFLCGFAVFGMIFTIAGAALPQIIRAFGWSYAMTGAVLAASSIGYALSTFLSGWLAQRVPPKAVLVAGLLFGAAGMTFFVRWPSPWLNFVLNLGVGLCQGSLEVICDYELIHMETNGQSRKMNLMHSTFCIGAIAGPGALGAILKSGYSMLSVFAVAAALMAGMAVLFALTRFPAIRREPAHARTRGAGVLRQPLLALATVLLFVYVGIEIGVSSWISEYSVKVLGAAASTGAFLVAAFWIGLFIGRLSISWLYKGRRQELIMLGISCLAAAALLAMLLVRSVGAVAALAPVIGLGLSGMYPLTITVVGKHHKSGVAVGTVTTGGATGAFIFPFIMALLAQTVGVQRGFWLYLGMNVALACLSLALVRMVRGGRIGSA
jgi:fucose permease